MVTSYGVSEDRGSALLGFFSADCQLTTTEGTTLGILRKTMAVGTGGMISYRNKEERATKYAKQTRNAARAQVAQNAMMLEHQRQMINQADHANVREEVRDMRAVGQQPTPAAAPPAGFYTDPSGDQSLLRWFDGNQWTDMTKPRD